MISDIDDPEDFDPVDEDSADDDDDDDDDIVDDDVVVFSDDDDDEGSTTAEINVDALVAKIDSTDAEELARRREIRRKLEALREARDDEFSSTYNFNLDEEI